jgi:Fibronectin type III domain
VHGPKSRVRVSTRPTTIALTVTFATLLISLLLSPARVTQATSSIPRADTFVRADSSNGWGTSSDGNSWTLLSGTSAPGGTVGISGNKGILTLSTASLFSTVGPPLVSADQEGLVRWSVDSTSATAGIILRAQNSANYYMARYSGANTIQFRKVVAGTGTSTNAFSFTPAVGTAYWLRFRVQGSMMAINVWADGTPEPATWGYTTVDTALTLPGGVGLYGFASRTSPNTFDSFSVTDATPASSTPTPTSTLPPTLTPTQPATATITTVATPSATTAPTPTDPPTDTPAPTGTPTTTPLPPGTPTDTPTASPLVTATPTNTPVPTLSVSDTPTPTDTPLPMPAPDLSSVAAATDTPTPTNAPLATPTDTPIPTLSISDTPTPTDTPLPLPTPTAPPTDTPLPTDTPTSTPLPTATPTPAAPTAPSNLTAIAVSSTEIDLSWTNTDPSTTGYIVQRSPDGLLWTTLTTSVPGTATSYQDLSVTAGLTYSYQVLAGSATGTSSPSTTASATTTPAPSSMGDASLSVAQNSAGTTVQRQDSAGTGWQVFFNAAEGGSITSIHQIDGGMHTEVMQQAVLHSHVQSYLNVNGTYVSNQQPGAQISVLRTSPELVGIRTVSTSQAYHVSWTFYYYLWSNGQIFVQVRIQNTGATALSLASPDSVEINHDGLLLASSPNQSPFAWYATKGAVTSPISSKVVSGEPDHFGRTPSSGALTTLGSALHKLTPWSANGIASYGIRNYDGGTGGRTKEQWMGTLQSFPAGKTLTFSLLLHLRRDLAPSQSVTTDADYRLPSVSASVGSLATTDTEPVNVTLSKSFNPLLGAHVINATNNHANIQLQLPSGVTTRRSPRFKIAGWSKGAPTVRWGTQLLQPGQDYNYAVDPDTGTLYLRLDFDVVAANPVNAQRVNEALDIS